MRMRFNANTQANDSNALAFPMPGFAWVSCYVTSLCFGLVCCWPRLLSEREQEKLTRKMVSVGSQCLCRTGTVGVYHALRCMLGGPC